ncbi:MAG TPA: maleylpyruvate isomerase N-terminal domain-containing protein [Acidimicrobiales bacterium]|nr:maleylpyruvate isomerase N-terminal domain-containing protein [Acidimicrobiales bacterium]
MQQPSLPREEVDVYVGAVDWLRGILARAEVVESWNQPSAVARYSVGGVAAHAVHGVLWLEQVLKDAEPTGLRMVKVPEYMGLNRVDGEDDDPFGASLRSAAEAFAATGAHIVAAALTVSRDELVTLLDAAPASRPVPVIRVAGAYAPLSEYLPTRILEAIVHGDDVVSSVPGLQVPDPPPGAVSAALEVCLELARARVGDLESLRAFTRAERAIPDALRVL